MQQYSYRYIFTTKINGRRIFKGTIISEPGVPGGKECMDINNKEEVRSTRRYNMNRLGYNTIIIIIKGDKGMWSSRTARMSVQHVNDASPAIIKRIDVQ